MASTSRSLPPYSVAATIDLIGEDLLQNIAISFAYAACINRSWNLVCDRILCRPKHVSACSFNTPLWEPRVVMVDKFVTDIREFSTSISGYKSPAAIIMFSEFEAGMKSVMKKMDYAMSADTVIVGDSNCQFLPSNGSLMNTTIMEEEEHIYTAVALVFTEERNKPPGMGETRFHDMLSNGLSPAGPTYKASSVREKHRDSMTWLTARREGFA